MKKVFLMMTAFGLMLSMLTSCGEDNAQKEETVTKENKTTAIRNTAENKLNENNKMDGKQAKAIFKKYIEDNNILVAPTKSGLYYVKTKEGNGVKPAKGDIVKVHYTGKFLNGKVFDSSVERNEPIEIAIGVGQLIPGWDEGILMMSKGEKGVLYVPYDLAYGERGYPGAIPPFSNMIFEVELIDFQSRR